MRLNKYPAALIASCLAFHSAVAQNADLNGNYSVTESWSVTIAVDNGGETPTFSKTYHGTETGTLAITNGTYTLINKTGASVAALNDISETIYGESGDYEIDGNYPVPKFAGKQAIVQLSFFVVAVTIPVNSYPIPVINPYESGNDVYSTTGGSLDSLSASGDEYDPNTGFTASASSTSSLGTPAAGGKASTAVTFSETWVDKVACTGSSSQGSLDCEPYSGGKFTLKAVITADDFGAVIDPSQLNEDTLFDIALGDYEFRDTLGDAPGYVAGASKATFQLSGDLCTAKDVSTGSDCPQKVYETISLAWTTKAVTVSVSAKTGSDANGNAFESAIDADYFDGNDTGPVVDTVPFSMDLGSLSVSSDSTPVFGTVVTKNVTDKSGNRDTLSSVSIKGTLQSTDLGQ